MERWSTGSLVQWICWNCGERSWQTSIGSTRASVHTGLRGRKSGVGKHYGDSGLLSPVLRLLTSLPAWHHHNTGFGYRKPAGAVVLFVVANHARFRNLHPRIDNGAPDAAVAPDLHIGHQNRILHFAVTVDAHASGQHAADHPAAGDYATRGDNGIHGQSHAAAFLRENELGGRRLHHARANGPVVIV